VVEVARKSNPKNHMESSIPFWSNKHQSHDQKKNLRGLMMPLASWRTSMVRFLLGSMFSVFAAS
jgi:hypothetical protein